MERHITKEVQIGNRWIGGNHPIAIQSMTNTKTEDVEACVAQILRLEKAGCDIIRVAVPTMEAAESISKIKKQIHIPLVADIHFDYRLAIAALINTFVIVILLFILILKIYRSYPIKYVRCRYIIEDFISI